MKSNSTFQALCLILLFITCPGLSRGENKEKLEAEKEADKPTKVDQNQADKEKDAKDKKAPVAAAKEESDDKEKTKADDAKPQEKKPDPKAEKFAAQVKEFEKVVKAEIDATKLANGRQAQLQAMAVAAYREKKLKPLWDKGVDLAKVNQSLVKLLKQHGFENPELSFAKADDAETDTETKSKSADAPNSRVPHHDLLVTLNVAETSLFLKQGPDSVSEWPNWSYGDTPNPTASSEHWNAITERFGKTASGKANPQKVAEAFIPQNRIYQHLFKEIQKAADPASEAPELKVTSLVKVGRKYEQAPELARFLISEGFLPEESVKTDDADEKAEMKSDDETDSEDSDEAKSDEEKDEADCVADKPKDEEDTKQEPGINEGIYTKELSTALKEFQKMNGLQADGILGPKTAERISNRDEEEAKALLINLHRARRFPDSPGEKFLHANIPSGEVYGFSAGKETLRMRIVFGKNRGGQRTPIFRDEMERVVFRPYWNVPYNIAVSEGNYSDTGYLSRNGFKIISSSGRELPITNESLAMVRSRKSYVRQDGGTNNALGIVKFLFPNKHSVYFHDTPAKHYFKNSYRAQSHGCVRLQDPEGMANWVLSDYDEWDADKISSALNGRRQEVNLDAHIPVYITYFTAMPDATMDDKIGFYQDIYNYDRPDAVVDAPGPKVRHVPLTPVEEVEPDKPTTLFSLFGRRNKDKDDNDSDRSNRSPFSRSKR